MFDVDWEYESETEEEFYDDLIDPSEYDEDDWIAYHSDNLWNNWEILRQTAYDKMEPEHVNFSDYCSNQFKEMRLKYT